MMYVEGMTHAVHVAGSSGRQRKVATAGIVSYSRAGSTWRLAEVVSDGACTADARVQMTSNDAEGAVNNVGCDVLAAVGRTIFGCPTHIGGPSSKLKRFVDPTVRGLSPTLWRDKRGGWFVDSTGTSDDKRSTVTYCSTLTMRRGMGWIGAGRMLPADPVTTAEFWQRFAALLTFGNAPNTSYVDFTGN
jgi:NAD(P)H dehydrogenase (quinone)